MPNVPVMLGDWITGLHQSNYQEGHTPDDHDPDYDVHEDEDSSNNVPEAIMTYLDSKNADIDEHDLADLESPIVLMLIANWDPNELEEVKGFNTIAQLEDHLEDELNDGNENLVDAIFVHGVSKAFRLRVIVGME